MTMDVIDIKALTLVLGGARSGKSVRAEAMVAQSGLQPVYVATARIWDNEMRERVDLHKARRHGDWINIEEPDDLAGALSSHCRPDRIVLVDCLTLWVTNLMLAEANIVARFDGLMAALDGLNGPVVMVSNEVGLGIVPDNKMARDFRDHAGRLHQMIAAKADRVELVVAGLPMTVKG